VKWSRTFSRSRTTTGPVIAFIAVLAIAANNVRAADLPDWPTFDGTASRAGSVDDRSFRTSNVASLQRRWVATLERGADSTPIVLAHVPGRSSAHPLIVQTDTGGTTYGIDGSSGKILWRFATTGPKITASTPVADPSERFVYVPAVDGRVHKLAALTGKEVREHGFPTAITRMPEVEKDASPLNLANGYLYAVTSGYIGDAGPYDGHVVAIRLSDGTAHVLNSLCSNEHMLLLDTSFDAHSVHACPQQRSGIWARGGAVVDPDPAQHGRIYVATGNGAFDANHGGHNYGDSALVVDADGSKIEQYFTPKNFDELESTDADLGSTAPALLPREPRSHTPLLAVQGGKGRVLHLLDRTHFGGVGGALQNVDLPDELFTAPAVSRDASGKTSLYLGFLPGDTGVTAYRLVTDGAGRSRLEHRWTSNAHGTSPVVSNGVVFVAASGALSALDAQTGKRLWSSRDANTGGTIGDIHWQSPVAVNGWVYCSDEDRHVTAYALSRR